MREKLTTGCGAQLMAFGVCGILLLSICASLVGCGSDASRTLSVAPTATSTLSIATLTDITSSPTTTLSPYNSNPDPISPDGWKVFTSTYGHYTIEYPANWITTGSPTLNNFTVFNYNPAQTYGGPVHSPLLSIEVDVLPNPQQLDPISFLDAAIATDPTGATPPASTQIRTPVPIAGRNALQVIQQPYRELAYLAVQYYIPNGTYMVLVSQSNATNGMQSDVLEHMVGSFKFSS